MDTLTSLTRSALILYVPLLVSALPLLSILKLVSLRSVGESVPLLFLSTVDSGVLECVTSCLAFMICSAGMSIGVETKGLCVTGAVTYLLIGGVFILTAISLGLYQSVRQAIH